jgi:hypothetical protein
MEGAEQVGALDLGLRRLDEHGAGELGDAVGLFLETDNRGGNRLRDFKLAALEEAVEPVECPIENAGPFAVKDEIGKPRPSRDADLALLVAGDPARIFRRV